MTRDCALPKSCIGLCAPQQNGTADSEITGNSTSSSLILPRSTDMQRRCKPDGSSSKSPLPISGARWWPRITRHASGHATLFVADANKVAVRVQATAHPPPPPPPLFPFRLALMAEAVATTCAVLIRWVCVFCIAVARVGGLRRSNAAHGLERKTRPLYCVMCLCSCCKVTPEPQLHCLIKCMPGVLD